MSVVKPKSTPGSNDDADESSQDADEQGFSLLQDMYMDAEDDELQIVKKNQDQHEETPVKRTLSLIFQHIVTNLSQDESVTDQPENKTVSREVEIEEKVLLVGRPMACHECGNIINFVFVSS